MGADDHHDDHGHSELTSEQSLKVAAIFIILIAGYVGAITPYLIAYFISSKDDDEESRKKKYRRVQIAMKILTCISIGVVIATVLIHLLPHGVSELKESGNALFKEVHEEEEHHDEANTTNSTNSTDDHDEEGHADHPYPFGYLFAMVAFFVVFFASTEINWYGVRKLKELKGTHCDPKEEAYLSGLIKLWTMEIGIFIHSIVVGITLGVANTMTDVRTLTIVLVFHQVFEGLAIGSMTVTTKLSFWKAFGFQSLFAFAVPVGIAIGLGVEDKTDAVTRGVFLCLGAGVLLYTGCVEMLPHLFGSHEHHAHGPLPLAELHQRVHESSADAADNTAPDATKEGDQQLKTVKTGDEQEENNNNKKEAADVPTGEVAASPSSSEHSHNHDHHEHNHDDHADDESFAMRFACYVALIFGASVQSVLGIWA